MSELVCTDERRRQLVRRRQSNGVDYVEVSDDQLTLTVFFLAKAPPDVAVSNVRIDGGRRIRGIRVTGVTMCRVEDPDLDDCMRVTVDRFGDFSTYRLCLVEPDQDGRPGDQPMHGLDPRYYCAEFSFKIGCPSETDCAAEPPCPPPVFNEPHVDYLAKDYASFRQLILDRLALTMPGWTERSPADVGVALVELLSYMGDYLSYHQDAVATEAYLDTARLRTSVRRHARLVDYAMHEGCNARAFVSVRTDLDVTLPADVAFLTSGTDPNRPRRALTRIELARSSGSELFEPVTKQERPIWVAQNTMHIYTWGDRDCCLPRGATTTTLVDTCVECPPPAEAPSQPGRNDDQQPESALRLHAGDVIIFEEVVGPTTGDEADADPAHRHAVRLTRVETPILDPITGQRVVEVAWGPDDALPFTLCVSTVGPSPLCRSLDNVTVARGNVVLVDHGGWVRGENLGAVPVLAELLPCADTACGESTIVVAGRFRPRLQEQPLTYREPIAVEGSAAAWTHPQGPRRARPQIALTSTSAVPDTPRETWVPVPDLLASSPDDAHFVAEIDNDGRATLRFGDGELGRMPEGGSQFVADYRIGNGPRGNVGAETILLIVFDRTVLHNDLRPRNPMPATGGTAPETLRDVKLRAPQAYRREQVRAVTADDYARLAERHPAVQRAAGVLRFTGSWTKVQVAIDAIGGTADPALLNTIGEQLQPYRRILHDVAVVPATQVPLRVALFVCVLDGFLKGHVEAALRQILGSRRLPDGRLGFFHPDNLTFAADIRLSRLVAAAQVVAGVESVEVTALQRLEAPPAGELEEGILRLGPLEIARLDDDPNFPENGRLELTVEGGR
jgi:hypothetical protein